MFRKTLSLRFNPIFNLRNVSPFSTVDTVAPMAKDKTVRDLRNILYKPIDKIEFDKDERALLYYYESRFYTSTLMYAKYLLPFAYIAKLIANNPFYITFPAALPIMFVLEIYLLRKVYNTRKMLHSVVGEIYLLKDGETIEIIYKSKFWRKIQSAKDTHYYYIPSMKVPEADENTMPMKGDLFPTQFPYIDNHPAGWAWRKYFRNPKTFFTVPKHANYKNMEILVAALNGKVIDTSKANIIELNENKKERFKWV